jgi:TusA-related sulfurtransferase
MMKNIKTTAIVLILWTLTLSSCYSVMPISNTNTATKSKANGKSVIVYYDSSIGTDTIEKFIKKNNIEVLYRYNNIHGYALKLQNDKQRTALEKTKGVLSVQNDLTSSMRHPKYAQFSCTSPYAELLCMK